MSINCKSLFCLDKRILHYPSSNGHYYFVHGWGSTQECRDQCKAEGGRLLIVRDEAQHKAMREVVIHFWSRWPTRWG